VRWHSSQSAISPVTSNNHHLGSGRGFLRRPLWLRSAHSLRLHLSWVRSGRPLCHGERYCSAGFTFSPCGQRLWVLDGWLGDCRVPFDLLAFRFSSSHWLAPMLSLPVRSLSLLCSVSALCVSIGECSMQTIRRHLTFARPGYSAKRARVRDCLSQTAVAETTR
jgi:hypothetical protein